ncbi:MAG: N-formylglutamate amidohydrolase [Alphaproteobacteria bacterium]|nr:N-formylglutamate amidohydrolase [Alphaproteobacteria bacterium]
MKHPYILHTPKGEGAPIFFDSPHSGKIYPDTFEHKPAMHVMRTLEDMYVEELFGAVPSLGAGFLEATFPRNFIDLNRQLSDLDPSMVEDGWVYVPAIDSRYARTGKGLIWKEAYSHGAIYKGLLSKDDVEDRIENYYKPYHKVLKEQIDDLHMKHGVAYHINCHSMPGISSGGELDEKGAKRPDVVVSDRFGQTADPIFTKFIMHAFQDHGLSVKENDPYQGGEIVAGYGKPDMNIHSVQIELNRDLYMDHQTLEKTDGFETLQVIVSDVCRQICEYAKGTVPAKVLPKGLKDRRRSGIQAESL